MPMLLLSFAIAVLAEVALFINWRVLDARDAAPAGIFDFIWIWPCTWAVLLGLGLGCMLLSSRMASRTIGLQSGRTAAVMVLRLFAPILLVVGPGLMLLYSLVMVLAAVGATSVPSG